MKTQSSKVIDVEFLREIIDNDREFEKELLNIFLENAQRNMAKMEEALNAGDNNSWYMAAHAFKGASASIGAFGLSQMLEYAQKHPEENVEQKSKILADVKNEFKAVHDFIKQELM
jgi:HPt (histidine-containing phosphotransfer) domain-containing protein